MLTNKCGDHRGFVVSFDILNFLSRITRIRNALITRRREVLDLLLKACVCGRIVCSCLCCRFRLGRIRLLQMNYMFYRCHSPIPFHQDAHFIGPRYVFGGKV